VDVFLSFVEGAGGGVVFLVGLVPVVGALLFRTGLTGFASRVPLVAGFVLAFCLDLLSLKERDVHVARFAAMLAWVFSSFFSAWRSASGRLIAQSRPSHMKTSYQPMQRNRMCQNPLRGEPRRTCTCLSLSTWRGLGGWTAIPWWLSSWYLMLVHMSTMTGFL